MNSTPRVCLVYAAAGLFALIACCVYFLTGGDVAHAAPPFMEPDGACLLSIL